MANLGSTFDSNQHEDFDGAFDPIPAGKYPMMITASSIETNKAQTGQYIKFEFTVLDGQFKGRKVWANLNIRHPNPVAVEIANKELASICRATGKLHITDTQELHGIPFLGAVKVRPAKGDWPAANDMTSYKPLPAGYTPPPMEQPTPPTTNQGLPPAASAPPANYEPPAHGDSDVPGGVPWD